MEEEATDREWMKRRDEGKLKGRGINMSKNKEKERICQKRRLGEREKKE